MKLLVSACLVGDNCKYNGGNNLNASLVDFLTGLEAFKVCPEVLGWLPTSLVPAENRKGHGMFSCLCIKAGYKVLDIEDFEG